MTYNCITRLLCEYSKPNTNTRIDKNVEMMTTVLHGWFVNALTQRVIQESLQEFCQRQHDQLDHQCDNYERIKNYHIQLCHMVAL